ncbi:MAG: WxcM-like domain-containing protein [Lachnospiraceae bacterium]|nr:WxcM-like domain-containing protein [Lachnospiraceae bacterium]
MEIIKYPLQMHGDDRGHLVVVEEKIDVPFEIKRVYYIVDTRAGEVRGKHAHKSLEQIMVCVHGSVKVTLDDGTERKTVVLDDPCEGLYIANNIWREMWDFSEHAVLIVFASKLYDENDYIRDYDEFLRYVGKEAPAAE